VILVAPNMAHAERLTGLLRGYGLALEPPSASDEGAVDLAPPLEGRTRVKVVAGSLSEGFASACDRLLLLAEAEIFGKITRRQPAKRRRVGVGSLAQLRVGDYVVHVLHGIGCYAGLVKLTLGGVPGDYVLVEYAGTDKLYLPVYRLGEVERYASADAKPPKVDRMGGATFATKTRKVKKEVRQMAEELLQIYAQRQAMDGHAFPEPDEMCAQFEAMFPFEETPDQEEAIAATQDDLGRPQPLDRLICGDVGFGKTEVALRAAFRVATSGKQVAVLAPTTVLVQQHYLTFRDRMSHFAVNVVCLNRFLDTKERRRVIQCVRDGSADVVIGTHRLLSRDVHFRDLGLVVIDEEQRFGVAQKERFKKLKARVDVLTLTATPIPRTLHMSLLGIREISLIMTPPVDRLAVRTFLTRAGDGVIEEGIRKELARGGQVFYVVPRIRGIEEHAVRVRELVPEARVAVAHGKMPAEMLERTMLDFVEHRTDVLVSTTIIESGLDIPRANTMFIARADAHGLAQLYQLRGRIGRSKHRAYCYLMVSSLAKLKPDARHRLEAIQRHSELGSGFNVASQDLEIRGAGDMLGARQSGYIQSIGFEAYTRILEEAVAELRGEPIVREADPEIVFDVPAFLPDSYVTDTGQRLDLYRRLSAANTREEVEEVMEEVRDRFGEPPQEALHLGQIMVCKTYGRRLRALVLELKGRRFSVRLGPDTPLSGDVAAGLQDATDGYLRLVGGDRIATTVPAVLAEDRSEQLEACQQALAALSTYVHVTAP
jgi:transcription-repair coupling factor (superfamily II helicase)